MGIMSMQPKSWETYISASRYTQFENAIRMQLRLTKPSVRLQSNALWNTVLASRKCIVPTNQIDYYANSIYNYCVGTRHMETGGIMQSTGYVLKYVVRNRFNLPIGVPYQITVRVWWRSVNELDTINRVIAR